MINGFATCGITKIDVLGGLKEIQACVSYERSGKTLKSFPTNPRELAQVTPVYETYDGWDGDISGVTRFQELPAEAQTYLRAIEQLTGVDIVCVSVGPKRSQTIMVREMQW